jgi:hypothetical protein
MQLDHCYTDFHSHGWWKIEDVHGVYTAMTWRDARYARKIDRIDCPSEESKSGLRDRLRGVGKVETLSSRELSIPNQS